MVNRIAAHGGRSRREAKEGPDGLYERIGLAVAEFLTARREGRFVTVESYVALFTGHEDVARECFEAAELLLHVREAGRSSR